MNIFKKWFKRKKEVDDLEFEFITNEEGWEDITLRRDDVVMFVKEQREAYVRNCLEQIKTASEETEKLSYEYNLVTAYLTDMEEIESLPKAERKELVESAKKIVVLEHDRQKMQGKSKRMTDLQYRNMERIEEGVEEGCQKLQKTEEYQALIKQDLGRLDGEKHAYYYRKGEVQGTIANTKGMVVICTCALFACMAMLAVLQFGFRMDTQLGYILSAGVSAIVITAVYIKHMDAKKELQIIENSINKIILLQNKVKIRYVNNTNLLEYYHLKYGVGSLKELEFLWGKYIAEKEERDSLRQTGSDLDFYQSELINTLRRFQLKDPNVWVHQAEALVNEREMVEIRHNLIIRRQKLRKQIEDNKDLAEEAQNEVKDIVEKYPKYAREILEIVAEYEK